MKREGQGSPGSLSNTTEIPYKKDPEEEKPHDYAVPQQVPFATPCKLNQNAVYIGYD